MKKFIVIALLLLLPILCFGQDGGINRGLISGPNFIPSLAGTTTWGSGSAFTWTFDAGTTDPTFTFGSGILLFGSGVFTFPNVGLSVYDTNASHYLIFKPGSDLTANKTLTFTTGDLDRTITLSGNPTLADWFDQAVKVASSPTFANLTVTTINGLTITSTAGTLTIPNNASAALVTSGNFSITLTSTAATNVTLPIDGTLYGTKADSITSAALLTSISDETGTGVAVFGTSPTFTTQIISPIVYGSAAASGGLTLTSTSSGTKGDISIGRLTLSDLANSSGIVFGNLNTATRGIDMSGSGLSGEDYWLYLNSNNYWSNDILFINNMILTGRIDVTNQIYGNVFRSKNAIDMIIYNSDGKNLIFGPNSTSSVLIGNYTAVGSLTSCTRNASTTITRTGHGLSVAAGDLVHITASTGSTDLGFYTLQSYTANTLVVDRALSGSDSSIALTVYKDVIGMFATSGASGQGQRITGYSHQNAGLQFGGHILATTVNLTSKDIYIGGDIGFSSQTANGSIATAMSSLGPTGAQTTIQGWIKIIDSAGTARYIPYW